MAANSSSRSICAAFEITAAAHARREFLHVPEDACRGYADGALTLTYGEAHQRINGLAARLQAAGYGAGHRVGVALDNRPDFFLWFLALSKLEASIVPLNAAMSQKELAYLAGHADLALTVTHQGHAAHVRAALPAGAPLHVIRDGETAFAGGAAARA